MKLFECSGCGGMVSDNTDFCSQCGSVIKKPSQSKVVRTTAVIILLLLVLVVIASLKDNLFAPPKTIKHEAVVPILSHGKIARAISSMRENREIVDAGIQQEGDTIQMVLVVAEGTAKERAEALGDQFMSEIESVSEGEAKPESEMTETRYSYLIGIYTPDQIRIAVGSKNQTDEMIRW